MAWIIVGLIAASLIAHLVKLMPSAGVLYSQRLRGHARKLGYRVEHANQADGHSPLRPCVGYRQTLPRCSLAAEFSCQRTSTGWQWLLGSAATSEVAGVLEALPDNVQRIDRQSLSVLIWWVEPSTLEPLIQLDEALALLRAQASVD